MIDTNTLEVDVYTSDGKSVGRISLPKNIFCRKPNEHAIYEAVKCYLANQRRGVASTKTRSEVRGGGRKPYRQKHTGRARQGTIRSPILVGGGVVFGPKPRDFHYEIPKKIRRLALVSALSAKAQEGNIYCIEPIVLEEPKTKNFFRILKNLKVEGNKTLFIFSRVDETVWRAFRNIPNVLVRSDNSLNCYDVLWADKIFLSSGTIESIERILGK